METTNVNQTISTAPVQTQSTNQEGDDMISLREIFDIFYYNWKWFVLSALICLALSRLYLATKSNVYQRQAVMLVKDEGNSYNRRAAMSTDALMALNGVLSGSSVKNEVYILRSHLLMKEVAKKLHLDVLYTLDGVLRDVSLYDVKPFEVQFFDENEDSVKIAALDVSVLNDNEVHISRIQDEEETYDFDKVVRFGQRVKTPVGILTFIPNPKYVEDFVGKKIVVTHIDIERAANIVGKRISTGEMDKESTLVRITCTDTNIQRADDILNALLDAYKQSIIADKNQMAQSTADFIDGRLELIKQELSDVEGQLANFKQGSNIVDVTQSAQAYLNQSTQARQRTIQLQAQQATVNYLVDHIRSHSEGHSLIPSLSGVTDAGIQAQINKYNEMMLQRNRLVENSGENAMTIKEMDANLREMRQAILVSLKGFSSSVDLQVRQAQREENELKNTIAAVPQKEKKVIDITRQQVIKETLYTYLLNKREETALQLAISEANIRIIEYPFGSTVPISPRSKIIMLAALLFGCALPFVIIYAISLLNMGVRGRGDIEKYTTIPVIGEIPHVAENFDRSQIIVSEKSNDTLSEAFRLLRFNLNFVKKDARTIMFTSTVPSEGKTFISRNFAQTLALAGKSVILLDTDIRKRTQTALYNAQRREGLTSYLTGSEDNLSNLIIKGDEKYKVDLLPAGVRPPNPAELLMSDRLDQLIEELKKMYDYIIVDNVPAQVVADAGIVNRIADLTIYVVREGTIDRRYLPELERLHKENKFNNLTILINDTRLDKKSYGYGYSYGYRYGYTYGYGYGYGVGRRKNKK